MSLVGGYTQAYSSGHIATPHDFYGYHPHHGAASQGRFPEHTSVHDGSYFQNWVLGPQHGEMGYVSGDAYGLSGAQGPADYSMFNMLGSSENLGHGHGQFRTVKRRGGANKKERRRTVSINSAFANLRGCIPNVPTDTKLSKIKTLRLACAYISYLGEVLSKDDPKLAEAGFKADLSKLKTRRDHSHQESSSDSDCKPELTTLQNDSDSSKDAKKSKGRTGWPQTVWAAELKTREDSSR